jgi:hypothetical protein
MSVSQVKIRTQKVNLQTGIFNILFQSNHKSFSERLVV